MMRLSQAGGQGNPMNLDRSVYVLVITCPLTAAGWGPSPQTRAVMISSSDVSAEDLPLLGVSVRSLWRDGGCTWVCLQQVGAD